MVSRTSTRKWVSLFTALLMVFSLALPALAATNGSDIQGHWAENEMLEWIEQGFLKGFTDGTFRPNQEITRAEFMALVNRTFGFSEKANVNFKDVPSNSTAWYMNDVARAVAAGYIQGFQDGTIRPNDPITRQEVAAIVARILDLELVVNQELLKQFADANRFATWSLEEISAVVANGYMQGTGEQMFEPFRNITRAEAVATLDRVIKDHFIIFNKAGTYGPTTGVNTINGNVMISVPGVTLKNTIITGDLLFGVGIGDGDVYLDGVTVQGNTKVQGGGKNSIHIINSTLFTVIVDRESGTVRIVASGSTSIDDVTLYTDAILVEEDLDGEGFGNISVQVTEDGQVILSGDFENVEIDVRNVSVILDSGSINNLQVTENAENTTFELNEGTTVSEMTLNSNTTVNGEGTIEKAIVNSEGTSFEQAPKSLQLADGVTTEVGGETVDQPSNNTGGTSNSGGGTTGGGSPVFIPAINITSITINSASSITFTSDVADATIKWNGNELSTKTKIGTNTITVPLMVSGANNSLVVEKAGYRSFIKNDVVYIKPYNNVATLGTWEKDRTEPGNWNEENGWITLTTGAQHPSNSWYDWQGKGARTSITATDSWKVETQIELTEELLNGKGVRTSIWVQVDGVKATPPKQNDVLDWAILQFINDPTNGTLGWESWDSNGTGNWVTLNGVSVEEGIYTLTMIYESGKLSQYINGILVREYEISADEGFGKLSAPSYIIIQSRTFGDEYTARWKVPEVEYKELYRFGAKFVSDVAELKDAIESATPNMTILIKEGVYEVFEQIKIKKPVKIVGQGEVIIKAHKDFIESAETPENHLIAILETSDVILENLIVTNSKRSGINVFESTNVTLNNITSKDNTAAGLNVNSSVVVANNLNTSGNGWYGVNVDNGSSPSDGAPKAHFTLTGNGTLAEDTQIISDWGEVKVDAHGYTPYELPNTTKTVWSNRPLNSVTLLINMIDSLPTNGFTLKDEDSIRLALKAYDDLVDWQKYLVHNYNKINGKIVDEHVGELNHLLANFNVARALTTSGYEGGSMVSVNLGWNTWKASQFTELQVSIYMDDEKVMTNILKYPTTTGGELTVPFYSFGEKSLSETTYWILGVPNKPFEAGDVVFNKIELKLVKDGVIYTWVRDVVTNKMLTNAFDGLDVTEDQKQIENDELKQLPIIKEDEEETIPVSEEDEEEFTDDTSSETVEKDQENLEQQELSTEDEDDQQDDKSVEE